MAQGVRTASESPRCECAPTQTSSQGEGVGRGWAGQGRRLPPRGKSVRAEVGIEPASADRGRKRYPRARPPTAISLVSTCAAALARGERPARDARPHAGRRLPGQRRRRRRRRDREKRRQMGRGEGTRPPPRPSSSLRALSLRPARAMHEGAERAEGLPVERGGTEARAARLRA